MKAQNDTPKRSRRFWITVGVGVILLIAAGVFIIATVAAPESSTAEVAECISREGGEDCIQLPTFTGQTLAGEEVTLPDAFTSEFVLALIVFNRDQQSRAEPWLPVVQEMDAAYANLSFYDLALVTDIAPAARLMALGGMRLLMDEELHDNFVMPFLENREIFLEALDITDFETMHIVVMNPAGEVFWRIEGEFTEEKGDALREQLAQLITD